MISRKHAFACALVFLCTILSAPPWAWADDDDDGDATALLLPLGNMSSAGATFTSAGIPEEVVPAEYNGDLRDLPQLILPEYYHNWNEYEGPPIRRIVPSGPSAPDVPPVLLGPMPATAQNFEGISFNDVVTGGFGGSGFPPDVNGDVGPNHYIESVNDSFAIFNKTGTKLAAFTENSLWSGAGTGTQCDLHNQGDPVVLHDGLADRWILTNFAFSTSGGAPVAPFYQCFAVSKTSDPVAGGWWLYAVRMDPGGAGLPPSGTLNDYGKFGLWTDCLYMSSNEFTFPGGTFAGTAFGSFSRTAMFAGTPLSASNSSLGYISAASSPFTMIPSNLLGTAAGSLPPAGTTNYFVSESQTAFAFEVRKFTPGAGCGTGGTLGAATSVGQATYNGSGTGIPQPGTTNTLDTLFDRLMQKVQYRKIGSAESLWVVHDSQASGATNRPQWAQINVTGGTVTTTAVQQQIFAPDTTLHRWMASVAVDGQGNMALGYSRGNGTSPNFASIYYAGRLVGDPVNTLPQTEVAMMTGNGAQNFNCGGAPCTRWGDYTGMSVDPSDDCTFWYINEYYDSVASGTSGNWHTRIASFKYPTCGAVVGPAAKLAFTLQPNASYVSNATITVKVSVEDASGNVVTTDSSNVTVALTTAAGATLGGTTTVTAVNGVATFNNLTVDKVGTYTLTATDGALTSAVSSSFNITAGAASAISFSAQPVTSVAGATIPVVAHVQDAAGNPISGDNVTLAIQNNAGGSTLTVTTNPVSTNASGNATFAGVSLNKVGTGYTLKVTDTNLLTTNSNAFNITVGAASAISFSTQPVTSAAGATIPVVAHVQDASGNPISGDNVTLAIQNNAGGSTLTVTTNPVATNASGDATFAGVSLNKVGTGYTLKVTDVNTLTTNSNAFNITVGAASAISFSTQPVTSAAGATIPVVAHVQDANGNAISGDAVTLAIQNNAGGSTLTVTTNPVSTNASGDATFAGVSLNKVGTGYTLKVTDVNTLTTNSNAFNITAGAASAISFSTQPVTSAAGATIPVVAHVQDANGNPISGDNVTLAIQNNAGGSTLTVTTNPVSTNASGDATFVGVSLNKVGTGYTLKVTDANTLTTNSNAFNITAGAASAISFSTQPVTSAAGATIPVVAHVQDANGNPISGDNVTLAIQNNAGGSTLTVTTNPVSTNASGDATFAGVSLNKVGTGYTLKVTDANTLTTNSNAFNITAGAASAISFSTQPVTSAAGATIPVVAHVQDANGNPISGDNVTLAIQNNAGGSTLTVTTNPVSTNASGNATFAGVSLNKVGTGYTLKVTDTNLLTTNSSAFNITAGAAAAISFSTQPVTSTAGATIPVVAHVQDANGNPISGDNVTLAIQNNAGGSTLTVTTNPVTTNASGDATFSGVSLNKVGTGYTLKVTDTNLLTTNSNAFNITVGAASAISFSTQPVTSAAGATIPVVAHVQDANGNPISGDNVTLAIQNNAGGSTLTVTTNPVSTNTSGDATFTGVSLNKVGTGYTLKVTDTNLLTTNSSPFNITAGSATQLVFTTQPADVIRGAVLGTVAVTEEDANGNVVPDNAVVNFTITACGGPVNIGGVAMLNGVATLMSNQHLYTPATGLHVDAATGLLTGTSQTFNVLSNVDYVFADGYEACRL